ncbi:MAG: BCAM0308 family protein, partial [Nitrospirales bacterium]
LLQCPECQAVYHRKRWSLPGTPSSRLAKSTASGPKKPTRQVMVPKSFVCPACRKLRDGYAEGFLAIHWPNWGDHKTEVLGLIHNEESRAARNNPLERVMSIRTRPDGADIETTTEHFAQRLGKHLGRAFKGTINYKWSHKDKLARIEWEGPKPATRPRQKSTTSKTKK